MNCDKKLNETKSCDDNKNTIADEKEATLRTIMKGLSADRYTNQWFSLACVFVNEELNKNILHECSKEKVETYDIQNGCSILKGIHKMNVGYKIATLYFYLKQDDPSLWTKLQPKRNDFWDMMDKFNHAEIAKVFFNHNPSKYIYSNKKWFELNEYNIFKEVLDYKDKLFNNITFCIQKIITEQSCPELLNPSDEKYLQKHKLIKINYNSIGNSTFKKGVIDALCGFYYKEDVDGKLNDNVNLIAFKDKVYDIKTGDFREIVPEDYIYKYYY
jgi:hypothetical protein